MLIAHSKKTVLLPLLGSDITEETLTEAAQFT